MSRIRRTRQLPVVRDGARHDVAAPMPHAPLTRNQAHHAEITMSAEYRARLDRQRRQSDYVDAYPQPADTSNVALENRRWRERDKDGWLWAYGDE